MNRIDKLFELKKDPVLSVYYTAGFPNLNSTLEVMKALQDSGAEMVEIGMPYSDPLADGPVIQKSNRVALKNGMSIPVLFEQLKTFRDHIKIPVILMGYLNPVLQFGIKEFCMAATAVGIDGIIFPDLPVNEFGNGYQQIFYETNQHFIFLITPETSEERIRKIDSLSSGFIYAVSSSSTTGNHKDLENQEAYFRKLKEMKLRNPFLIGFGIKDKESFLIATKHSRGAIIGTAFIRALEGSEDIGKSTKEFLKTVLT